MLCIWRSDQFVRGDAYRNIVQEKTVMPEKNKKENIRRFTCLDLFSGAGGLSRGFYDAGYDVVLGVDFDDAALQTFQKNHGDAEVMKLDLFDLSNVDEIVRFLDEKEISLDVLVGGPPCQGFSVAGPRDMNDKRNTLYRAMVELASRVKPRAVVLENVPGMIQINDGIGAKRVVEDFANIGYKMTPKLLYAPDYGVPQIRKRVFFVGLRDSEYEYSFPEPTVDSNHYVTCEEAIGDLPSLQDENGQIIYGDEIQEYVCPPQNNYQAEMRKHSDSVVNHIGSIPIEKTRKMISLVPEGKNFRALPEEYRKLYKYHEALTRYNSKKPSLTINTGHRSHFHYKWNRIPTVRESARLQTFPDDFVFYGNKSEQYRQVGNAVPPLLGQVVARSLIPFLETEPKEKKYRFIDLFAGCGGLEDGFLQSGRYADVAAVEWLKPQVETLIRRLESKWGIMDAEDRVMHFDIQREEELFSGWDDPEFGKGKGLDCFVEQAHGVDVIIGGPPCQAYSVAGRVRDENGMRNDYRNYLFEHYLQVVDRYRPKVFLFENVPGILSAAPDGTHITERIKDGFGKINYEIIDDLKTAKINAAEFGVPQNRERVIILGLDKNRYSNIQQMLNEFYCDILPKYRTEKTGTVRDAIGDLPGCMPFYDQEHHQKHISHSTPECSVTWHKPRYHNLRDMSTFKTLAEDIESGRREYDSKKISNLYEEKIGSKSPIHRYHVLEPDIPSTTIIAHLYKDGNRFIHYDSRQSRTITVREAARIQSFDDDFDFCGSQGNAYQMIGNAVPPQLAKRIALALADLLDSRLN